MPLLDMSGIHGGYGGANILNGVSIAIEAHEIGVIVGPNGAGKSTTLKALFGLLKVSEGSVLFDGGTITNLPPEKLVRAGLSFVPQEFNVFPTMSVQGTPLWLIIPSAIVRSFSTPNMTHSQPV